MKWFVIGALTSFGLFAYAANQLRRTREQMTPQNLARGGARSFATLLEAAADAIEPASADH